MEKNDSGKTPKRGDLFWVNFEPTKGREQAGRRPAIIISPDKYNEKIGMVILCPITTKIKGYVFEVPLRNSRTKGAILSNHVQSMDYRYRDFKYIETVSDKVVNEVAHKINLLVP